VKRFCRFTFREFDSLGRFALLTLILSTAAVAGMLVFTWLALIGIRSIGFGWFEPSESLVMGSFLLLVGVGRAICLAKLFAILHKQCLPFASRLTPN